MSDPKYPNSMFRRPLAVDRFLRFHLPRDRRTPSAEKAEEAVMGRVWLIFEPLEDDVQFRLKVGHFLLFGELFRPMA
jgi:hypothetical protein